LALQNGSRDGTRITIEAERAHGHLLGEDVIADPLTKLVLTTKLLILSHYFKISN